jgi:hypothetical protein
LDASSASRAIDGSSAVPSSDGIILLRVLCLLEDLDRRISLLFIGSGVLSNGQSSIHPYPISQIPTEKSTEGQRDHQTYQHILQLFSRVGDPVAHLRNHGFGFFQCFALEINMCVSVMGAKNIDIPTRLGSVRATVQPVNPAQEGQRSRRLHSRALTYLLLQLVLVVFIIAVGLVLQLCDARFLLFLLRVVRLLFLQEALQRGDGDLGLRGGHVCQWWIIRVSTVVGSSPWINFLSPLSYVLYWSWRGGEMK